VPHALTVNRTVVPPPDRDRFFARARALRTHYQSRGCQYWVFEDADVAGAFVEFAEAADARILSDACASAPQMTGRDEVETVSIVRPNMYTEVAL